MEDEKTNNASIRSAKPTYRRTTGSLIGLSRQPYHHVLNRRDEIGKLIFGFDPDGYRLSRLDKCANAFRDFNDRIDQIEIHEVIEDQGEEECGEDGHQPRHGGPVRL